MISQKTIKESTMHEGERRSMERFPLKLPGLLSVVDENGKEKTFDVMAENICAGGAFCTIDEPLPVGTRVQLDLILSFKLNFNGKRKKSHINISGSVARTYEHGMAIRFGKKYNISPIKG